MNTTEAAAVADVTVDTIRTWCRRGAVASVKAAGRWVIDAPSLARRIRIGKERCVTTPLAKYRIEEGTAVIHGTERTVYTIVRTDGTPAGYGKGKDHRIDDARFTRRESAEIYLKFYERTPVGFRLTKEHYGSRSIHRGSYWVVTGSSEGDPSTLRHTWDEGKEVQGTWDAGTTWLDVLITLANQHAEGAAKRIQEKSERDAVEAAEAAVQEAREAQLDEIRRCKGTLATPRQVEYILQILAARERSGEGDGFFYGPTDRAGIEELSKSEASTYIDSLKGNY